MIYNSNTDINWNKFKEKSILITGGGGFIASRMVDVLRRKNEELNLNLKLILLVRDEEKAKKNIEEHNSQCIFFLNQDVCDKLDIDLDIDYILHMASKASPSSYAINPIETSLPNILGTINLLEYAKRKKISGFLFLSTGEVYGQLEEDQIPIKENYYGYLDPVDIRSCYAESKRMGENLCISYHSSYNIPTKIIRLFHTYGPGMSLTDGRVFADFVADIVANKDITLKSRGASKRPFCYVYDAVEGILLCLLEGASGTAYNLGNPYQEVSILELAQKLIKVFEYKKIDITYELRNQNENYLESPITRNSPNIEKLLKLGWRPETSIEEGFKKTVDYYENIRN